LRCRWDATFLDSCNKRMARFYRLLIFDSWSKLDLEKK
jgi:hypothetical protein